MKTPRKTGSSNSARKVRAPARAAKGRTAIRKTAEGRKANGTAAAKRPTRGASATRATSVGIVRLPHGEGLPLPAYQTPDSAGLDLVAALPARKPLTLKPRARALVPTGLVLELPRGTEAQVRPRSGLALKAGVTVLNSPGTIDADYRGEVQVLLVNLGSDAFRIARGDRIAQLIVAPVSQAALVEVAEAGATARGAGGFGSTGVRARSRGAKSKSMPKPRAARNAVAKRRPRG